MNDNNIAKEMSLKNFKIMVNSMKSSGIEYIKLLGGEPTLHSQFEEMVTYALENFKNIQLFTNGLFSEKTLTFLKKQKSKINYTFNVSTPGFCGNVKINKLIISRIVELSPLSDVSISIIIDPNVSSYDVSQLNMNLLTHTKNVRLGLLNPVVGEKNQYEINDFLRVGKNLIETIKKFKKVQPKLHFVLDCGFTRCMFTQTQYKQLEKYGIFSYYFGCFLGRSLRHFDIQTNLDVVSCYSLSSNIITRFGKEKVDMLDKKIFLNQHINQQKYVFSMCKKCKFHGREPYECYGPCLGFKIYQEKHELS